MPDTTAFMEELLREYRRRTPRSAALHAEASRHLPGGDSRTTVYHQPYPVYMEQGSGCRVTDVDGNEYLDYINNYGSLVHGHRHPEIMARVSEQEALATAFAAPTQLQVELASRLTARLPGVEQVRFCNSGTEATMLALRAARAHTGRTAIALAEGCYHGTSDWVSVAGSAGVPAMLGAEVVTFPFNDADETARLIRMHGSRLAAVMTEPVLGSAGLIPATGEYLQMLRDLTKQLGIELIFDEVQTLRLAYGGAQSLYGVIPDLTAMAKLIGGGFPVGALGGRAEIMQVFSPAGGSPRVRHGGTFNANPVTMAAGCAALDLLTPEAVDELARLGERLRTGLSEVCERAGIPGQVTGVGSFAQLHFSAEPVTDYRSAARADQAASERLHLALLLRGIFTSPRGSMYISTPMSEREIDQAVAAVADSLADLGVKSGT